MVTAWLRTARSHLRIALFTLSFVISGCEREPAPPDAILSSAGARGEGAQLFVAHCAICHGARGDGNGEHQSFMNPPPGDLTVPPWSERAHARRTFLAIRDGIQGTAMAPWPTLSERQDWELVAYIEALREGR